MTRFLICTSDADPCPSANQAWSTTAEILDPAQFGITPENILKMYTFGFGSVLSMFLIGYVLGIATGLIRKA